MPSQYDVRAWIAIDRPGWAAFLARCHARGRDAASVLGELVAQADLDELDGSGIAPRLVEPLAGQLELSSTPKRSSSTRSKRSSSTRSKRSSSTAAAPATEKAPRGRGKPSAGTRRRKLPVVADAVVEREAQRGAAAAKRSRRRGTIAVEGGDRHDAVIAKANKRSPSGKQGRPTRRRS